MWLMNVAEPGWEAQWSECPGRQYCGGCGTQTQSRWGITERRWSGGKSFGKVTTSNSFHLKLFDSHCRYIVCS